MFAYSIGEHQQGSAISDLDESRHDCILFKMYNVGVYATTGLSLKQQHKSKDLVLFSN